MQSWEVDIRTVDRQQLKDISEVKINSKLPKEERVKDFISQIGNPLCYKDGEVIVKIGFADAGATLEDRLSCYYENLKQF